MTNTSRRSLLAIMGLAGASSAVLTPEAVARGSIPGNEDGDRGFPQLATLAGQQARVADALQRLADAIRRGEAAATGLDILASMGSHSTHGGDDWLRQTIHLELEVLGQRDSDA